MKTKDKTFDSVNYMREQREKLSNKLVKMSKEEIVNYFLKLKSKTKLKPSA